MQRRAFIESITQRGSRWITYPTTPHPGVPQANFHAGPLPILSNSMQDSSACSNHKSCGWPLGLYIGLSCGNWCHRNEMKRLLQCLICACTLLMAFGASVPSPAREGCFTVDNTFVLFLPVLSIRFTWNFQVWPPNGKIIKSMLTWPALCCQVSEECCRGLD